MLSDAMRDYDSLGRFCSYWHQIDETLSFGPRHVLEVGIAFGLVSSYLRRLGLGVTTLDIEAGFRPDTVGSVVQLPFADRAFDVVVCCQVLEHLPFDRFPGALRELHRVARRAVVLSLPDARRVFRTHLSFFGLLDLRRLLPVPLWRPPRRTLSDRHEWEIDVAGYPRRMVELELARAGFRVARTYRVFERPYNHFYVLRKADMPDPARAGARP